MITVSCACGEKYFSDEKHIGSSILCKKCGSIMPIGNSSSSLANYDNDAKEPVFAQETEDVVVSTPIFSDKPSFKERFLNRRVTVLRLLVIVGIFSGLVITVVLLVPKLKDAKTAQQPEPSTKLVPSNDAKTRDAPDTKAKQSAAVKLPRASQPQQQVEPQPATQAPARIQARGDQPILRTQAPQLAQEELQPKEVEPLNPNRLHTGAAPLGYGVREGRCILKVINGTDTDAFVRVMRVDTGEQLYRNFYILAGATFTAERFSAGNYVLKVALGVDWHEAEKRFNYRRSFEKTEVVTLSETTTRELTADGYVDRTKFSDVTLTLHKVINGNFHSSPISEAEFWR